MRKALIGNCLVSVFVCCAVGNLVCAAGSVDAGKAALSESGGAYVAVDVPIDAGGGAAAMPSPPCALIGDFSQVFSPRSDRYRGNFFRMDKPASVSEFGFELDIEVGEAVDLYFSVHEAPTGVQPFNRAILDVVVPVVGVSGPAVYSTGRLPQLLELRSGTDYTFGVSWGLHLIGYGRNPTQHPNMRFADFDAGIFLGSVSQAFPDTPFPPIDPTDEGVYMIRSAAGGPWSMQICQAGACCLSGSACNGEATDPCCRNLVENDCLTLGGAPATPGVTCAQVEADRLGCPFVDGACCGTEGGCGAGGNCTETNVYACDDAGGTWFRQEVCDATICCPKGACCLYDGSCLDGAIEDDCLAAGGTYRGDDTTCGEVDPPCNAGACCLIPSGCDVQTEAQCAGSGVFQGFGVACTPNPCVVTGACCDGTSCYETTEADCTEAGHSYRGDDVLCADLQTLCGSGACCTGTVGCIDSTAFVCDFVPGAVFQGDGTTCDTLDPQCDGACCWAGGCIDLIDPASCNSLPGGSFVGYGLACPVLPEDDEICVGITTAACCLASGGCVDGTASACADLGGVYDPAADGSLCAGVTCTAPEPTGACCVIPGLCVDGMLAVDCDTAGGYYNGDGTECATSDCTAGACCLPEGGCTDTIAVLCDAANGTFDPANDCSTAGCEAGIACCLPSETCLELTPTLCAALDGSNNGTGTDCTLDPVCTRGACCVAGRCEWLREIDCTAAGGTRWDVGVACAMDACTWGACCSDNGGCIELEGMDCTGSLESFVPEGDCLGDSCPPAGACCSPSGACLIKTEQACVDLGAVYGGDATTCNGVCDVGACCGFLGDCANDRFRFECEEFQDVFSPGQVCSSITCRERGACCLVDGGCDIQTPEDCLGAGNRYRGAAVVCVGGANSCVLGACCLDDGTCQFLDPIDCDDSGGHYNAGFTCDDPVCPVGGACCLGEDEPCQTLTQSACGLIGGAYAGDHVDCTAAACARGACCTLAGNCEDDLLGLNCLALSGLPFTGFACADGVLCSPRGACCVAGVCSMETEADCTAAGGSRWDQGVVCVADGCLSGTCCGGDGSCAEMQGLDCTDPLSVFVAEGTCAGSSCPAMGGCCDGIGGCVSQTQFACESLGNVYAGEATLCDGGCAVGSCCEFDGTCLDDALLFECMDYQDVFQAGAVCGPDCEPRGACCAAGSCSIETEADCVAASGTWRGAAVDCMPDGCASGACCGGDGTCAETLRFDCTDALSVFVAGGDCAGGSCPAAGACCDAAGACLIQTQFACDSLGNTYAGDDTLCEDLVCDLGACCEFATGVCADGSYRFACAGLEDVFYLAEACDGGLTCEARGACCQGDICSIETEADCLTAAGEFAGVGVACDPDPCALPTAVIASDPVSGSVDARRPWAPGVPGVLFGWDSVTIEFNSDASAITPAEFTVGIVTGAAPTNGVAPSLVSVTPAGAFATLQLDGPIPYGAWTQITYDPSGESICLGYLPGNVNLDTATDPSDIIAVIDCINGITPEPCMVSSADVDRSGSIDPSDIIMVIDLLNGASGYDVWFVQSLPPSPCGP